MEICLVIEKLVSQANRDNYEVIVFPDGHWEITKWELTVPQPTLEEIESEWDIMNLDITKQNKLNELKNACNNAIFGQFTAQVDGVTYSFSNDSEAQSNFKDAKLAWIDGDIQMTDIIKWTAYDSNGVVVRLDLNKSLFDPINIARMQWQQFNVSKLRDTLEPQINNATTLEQVNQINW